MSGPHQRFAELFVGGDQAHGLWDERRGAKTERGPATPERYAEHLAGKLGLGLVPVRRDGTCRFAAIDIDTDSIDHTALLKKVLARRLPLSVFRSKSGGAHATLFMKEPGLAAATVIQTLRKWATILGYPAAEVFPKQTKITKTNLGNWINLPYFGDGRTTRYAVGPRGRLTLGKFLASVRFYDPARCTADETTPPEPGTPDAEEFLARKLEWLRTARPGVERNNYLYRASVAVGELVGGKSLARERAEQALTRVAKEIGLDEREIASTIRSGLDKGIKQPRAPAETDYLVRDGRIGWLKKTKDAEIWIPLCNFTAAIVEELLQDDGSGELVRVYTLEGHTLSGKPLPRIKVPAAKFRDLGWVESSWGSDAVLAPGFGLERRLHAAIHALSPNIRKRRVYVHIGWTTVDREPLYLIGNGAIGANGPVAGVEVALGPDLSRYRFPRKIENPAEAMRVSLELLDPDLVPLKMIVPLWAIQFRAPLASVRAVDVSLHVVGPTGRYKTTISALCLSHYGQFDLDHPDHLPAGWSSTANALELQTFLAKDAPLLIDDYSPTPNQLKEYEAKFDRVFRGQANQQSRARLNRDSSLRRSYPPRGAIISTGERHPPGQSLLARALLLEPQPGQVDLARLTALQEKQDRLPHAMASYVAWLAPQLSTLEEELETVFKERRRLATVAGDHPRVAGNVAQLWLGVEWALRFAIEIGAVTRDTAEEHRQRSWQALLELGREQARVVESERPTRKFLEVLITLCSQDRAALLYPAASGGGPKGSVLIGWEDADTIYLLPVAAFELVAKVCRDSGEPFATRQKMLQRDLLQEGLLCQVGNDGRPTVVKRLGGRPQRVLALDRARVARLLETELPAKGSPPPGDKTPLFDEEEVPR